MDELDANGSSKEGFGSVEKVVLLTFVSAVILMAVLGNLLVMVAVCRDRQLRKIKTNYFIVSLAFADLLVSVLVMPFGAIELVQDVWIYGEMFCLVRTSLDVLLTTASIFHLCCISLDRYYAICCQPLVYRNKMTPLRVAVLLAGCWAIPVLISFLPIMQGWNNIGITDLTGTPSPGDLAMSLSGSPGSCGLEREHQQPDSQARSPRCGHLGPCGDKVIPRPPVGPCAGREQ